MKQFQIGCVLMVMLWFQSLNPLKGAEGLLASTLVNLIGLGIAFAIEFWHTKRRDRIKSLAIIHAVLCAVPIAGYIGYVTIDYVMAPMGTAIVMLYPIMKPNFNKAFAE